jgi:hypothetical protein
MKLFIPTYKRVTKQRTWENLPDSVKEFTYLVCPESEAAAHVQEGRQVFAAPDSVKGIAATRQWILENADDEQILMLDDDQSFRCREDGSYKLRAMGDSDYKDMLIGAKLALKEYNAVGISAQAGNNRTFPKSVVAPGRMYNMYALNRSFFLDNDIRFDAMRVMEDFHVTLSMLKMGYSNAILQDWCWSSPGSNADGGCSNYRTAEVQREGALRLAELHKPFVTVVEKESKSWGNGLETRTDVRVAWKKALEWGLANGR